ncbi:ABC transporter ATP-binding protein [Rhizohabitans arisaemae]|uniref:ABC transporter ATP-binding protein n=1 Tax=Rhizohabitans arisaemae TaxID=2720610 RepID=UPI0024B26E5C|nr:ABC transporter ATP-binding protein [Rhizohabitans arisaemae]
MLQLPVADPGTPDARGPLRYLLWLTRAQALTIAGGVTFATLWWLGQAFVPAVLGKAIDAGITLKDPKALLYWSAILLGLGLTQAGAGIVRHRFAVFNWLSAAYRTVQVTARKATGLGATLPKRLSTGEVISVGSSDIAHIGDGMDIIARGSGAIVAIGTVTFIMIDTSLRLGLLVLIGVPLMALAVGPLLVPLHRRQHRHRDLQAELATRAGDIVEGLRVLRGIGGEQVFAQKYRVESQRVRRAGLRVAGVESILEGAQILLPGLLIAFITWLGARSALAGEITAGQLVTFYGYAVFLIAPLRTLTEAADKLTKAHVSARRVVGILRIQPEIVDEAPAGGAPPAGGELADPVSGLVLRPGRLTALAAAVPEEAVGIVERLGRYAESEVTYGGVRLRDLPLAEVRRRILVADNEARLFTGTLRDELQGVDGTADQAEIGRALRAACAEDVVEALPDGLDQHIAEAGREFSGGQQQRLRLVRALLADPEVLILVEPTSAVDAHTEARIAARLGAARAGRTTLVCTTSPLVLDQADHVVYVDGGTVRAEGGHRELLETDPGYHSTVTRGED